MTRALILILLLFALNFSCLSAAERGESLLSPKAYLDLKLTKGSTNELRFGFAPIKGQKFTKAIQFETTVRTDPPWNFNATLPLAKAITSRDVLVLTLWSRCLKSTNGPANLTIKVQGNDDPWPCALHSELSPNSVWHEYQFVSRSPHTTVEKQTKFIIFLGAAVQTVEIGPITLVNYGNLNEPAFAKLERKAKFMDRHDSR